MIRLCVCSQAGEILRVVNAMPDTPQAEPGEIEIEVPWGLSDYDLLNGYMAAGGEITPRPALPLPATHTLPAGADWNVGEVPAGTVVHDTPGGEMGVADGELTRTWMEPGEYEMRLDPPFPWMPATCRVTVT